MQFRLIRLKFRRRLRRSQKQVEEISTQAEEHIEQHLFGRFDSLLPVKRFIIGWIGLLLILMGAVIAQSLALSNYYQTLKTIPGGIFTEGILGRFTNANPIYATSEADTSVSRLVFGSLFTQDDSGNLQPELAKDYSVNTKGTVYTVHLKPHLVWQDGKPLTSSDVLYTFQTIQNPDALSPLQSSWHAITIAVLNDSTVVFTLPDPLASFPYSLSTGIVPKHILQSIPVAELRSADFNTIHMVGAGPFSLQSIDANSSADPGSDEQQVTLIPNKAFVNGKPKLDKFVVRAFASQKQLTDQFSSGQLTTMEATNPPPKSVQNKSGVISNNLLLRAANMVFFKTNTGILSDVHVRQAIINATNVPSIVGQLGYETPLVQEPLLKGQLSYDPSLRQASYYPTTALQQLTSDGWIKNRYGIQSKANKPLTFTLTVADTKENHIVAQSLQKQWQKIGIVANLQYLDSVDFQNALKYHSYDAILNGISIGIDPDVFVYWNSSQANIGTANALNFSEYKNATADAALEAGRTRINPTLRTIKYKPLLQVWKQDAPALGLYQPRLLYLSNSYIHGLEGGPIVSSADRFNNVQNWEIRQAKVTN